MSELYSENVRDTSDKSLENLDPNTKKASERNSGNKQPRNQGKGFANSKKIEPIPSLSVADNEVSLQNDNGARIVLGRDRNANLASGYGGLGYSGCSSIDLVVGPMAGSKTGPKDGIKVDPNFFVDAARIYISQKADIDEYFGLAEGHVGSVKTRSAIGIKADALRLISREGGIKLVTGKGNVSGFETGGEKNSNGGKIKVYNGIELIGGNDTEDEYLTNFFGINISTSFQIPGSKKVSRLQPMVKGDNLIECLEEVLDSISELNSSLLSFVRTQEIYNSATSTNIGFISSVLFPTAPAGIVQTGVTTSTKITNTVNASDVCSKLIVNLELLKTNYLKPTSKLFINSRDHKLT